MTTAALFGAGPAAAQPAAPSPRDLLAREILKELVEIDTTHATGNTTTAAEAMAKRLRAAGLPAGAIVVDGPNPKRGNLVARLKGAGGGKPIVLLAHLDVVPARREDWSMDPFKLIEKDGFFYGRGTSDDKGMAAIFVANLIRLQKEGWKPERDVVVALTADEEGGSNNGAKWLLDKRRDLVDGALVINEGSRGISRNGAHLYNGLQVAEKVYMDYDLSVTGKGGHSSLPTPDNVIYRLAAALDKLAKFTFPLELNEATRAYFKRMADVEKGHLGDDMRALLAPRPDPKVVERLAQEPMYNSMMRTTCVATELEGGHAHNALPQLARANVNCRIVPTSNGDVVKKTLETVVNDAQVVVKMNGTPTSVSPTSLDPQVVRAIEKVTQQMWPGLPVVPNMGTGATDSKYFRQKGVPAFGVSGLFFDIDDARAHGRDERVGIKSFDDGREFHYRLTKLLAGAGRS
jgi:acetylornithine deacetylase/succinyl-diaminopimelate desuccinylase-like protein